MSKLTLDALKERANGVVSSELLSMISGGLENDCHPEPTVPDEKGEAGHAIDGTYQRVPKFKN